MYELKKLESYLRVNLLGPGPRLIKKIVYRAAVSQRLRNTGLVHCGIPNASIYLVYSVEVCMTIISVVDSISCIYYR